MFNDYNDNVCGELLAKIKECVIDGYSKLIPYLTFSGENVTDNIAWVLKELGEKALVITHDNISRHNKWSQFDPSILETITFYDITSRSDNYKEIMESDDDRDVIIFDDFFGNMTVFTPVTMYANGVPEEVYDFVNAMCVRYTTIWLTNDLTRGVFKLLTNNDVVWDNIVCNIDVVRDMISIHIPPITYSRGLYGDGFDIGFESIESRISPEYIDEYNTARRDSRAVYNFIDEIEPGSRVLVVIDDITDELGEVCYSDIVEDVINDIKTTFPNAYISNLIEDFAVHDRDFLIDAANGIAANPVFVIVDNYKWWAHYINSIDTVIFVRSNNVTPLAAFKHVVMNCRGGYVGPKCFNFIDVTPPRCIDDGRVVHVINNALESIAQKCNCKNYEFTVKDYVSKMYNIMLKNAKANNGIE